MSPNKKPAFYLYLLEIPRMIIEMIRAYFFLSAFKPKSKETNNQRIILVLPGLLGNDASTKQFRKFLNKLNNITYGWGLGRNKGNLKDIDTLINTVNNLVEKHQQKITLIGWSLGGIYAREIAKKIPNQIEEIITLGSPFADVSAPNYAVWVFNYFNKKNTIDKTWWNQIHCAAPLKTTAIYSKSDGVVPWQCCMEQQDALHHNLEINSCHFGFCLNPDVFKAVANILN